MKIEGPSNKQLKVYDYIVAFMLKNQYSPSVREIGAGMGMRSTSTVYSHLRALKDWGLIDFGDEQPRTISLKGYRLVRI